MNRQDLPSPEYIRSTCGFSEPQQNQQRPSLKEAERVACLIPAFMMLAVKEYQSQHDLTSQQAAIRVLLAKSLGIQWYEPTKEQATSNRFSDSIREDIRRRYAAGEKLAAIASSYEISVPYASQIKDGLR